MNKSITPKKERREHKWEARFTTLIYDGRKNIKTLKERIIFILEYTASPPDHIIDLIEEVCKQVIGEKDKQNLPPIIRVFLDPKIIEVRNNLRSEQLSKLEEMVK